MSILYQKQNKYKDYVIKIYRKYMKNIINKIKVNLLKVVIQKTNKNKLIHKNKNNSKSNKSNKNIIKISYNYLKSTKLSYTSTI